jgi:dTDP-glucose pyrophosphorylase
MIKFIMPCAGFGTRVQHRTKGKISKELLPDPNSGRPLIEKHLDLAKEMGAPVYVVTRAQKKDLIQYLENKKAQQEIFIQLIEASKEWPDTVLKAKEFFAEKNILILPDTVFSPSGIVSEMAKALEEFEVVYATHQVTDPQNWGILSGPELWEKPTDADFGTTAWGLIAFRGSVGESVFEAHLQTTVNREKRRLLFSFSLFSLDLFQDLTRG